MNDIVEKHQQVPDICWSCTEGQSSLSESTNLNLSCVCACAGIAAATANMIGNILFMAQNVFFQLTKI
jgi:hypothetical protein